MKKEIASQFLTDQGVATIIFSNDDILTLEIPIGPDSLIVTLKCSQREFMRNLNASYHKILSQPAPADVFDALFI